MSESVSYSDPTSFSSIHHASALSSIPTILPNTLIPSSTSGLSSSSALPLNDQQTLAIQLLISGHVNSFVDFFYLTHQSPSNQANNPTNNTANVPNQSNSSNPTAAISSIPPSDLSEIRTHLMSAESAHRHANSSTVYHSYNQLAHYFQLKRSDPKTAVYFYEKCLDIADSSKNPIFLLDSNLNLGIAYSEMGEIHRAIQYFESAMELAQSQQKSTQSPSHSDDSDDKLQLVGKRLIDAYRIHAEEHEKRTEWEAACLFYKKCLNAAIQCKDARNEALATYRLGVAYSHLNQRELAIESHLRYLGICKSLADQLGEGAAYAALANCYKDQGDLKLAISYLEKYHVIAMKNKQLIAQAEACAALGAIYSSLQDHSTAVNYFERTFEIAKSIQDRRLIDSARINLGMARGNLQMGKFMGVVKENLPALLNWKSKRTPFK